MRRFALALATVLIMVSLTASGALAGIRISGLSFTASGGSVGLAATTASAKSKSPTASSLCVGDCTGLNLNAAATLTGLGSEDAIVTLIATGRPSFVCTNPGGNQSPGQNPSTITVTGDQNIGAGQISRNGKAPLAVTSDDPTTTLPGTQGGCPNDNWTASLVSITFVSARIIVVQDGVVTFDSTFDLTT
jgi:hypothetical protein